ncbi:hypothetical protein IGB42_00969 [Andreprevotia sp. IGB-42]|uniref:hypothetical protein n=1 Tax=Andreprevotia sp. IGB-42 TaxID=2497473 RepID=UPI001358226F|nr:hypothetical protein [Andreprevotia sp. IGB-42]KAF0814913.1 hypothetical protein IGB42_00969 [Andreprevotia sp. IGB-42]
MKIEPSGIVSPDLKPQLQWLWHSGERRGFLTGDDRKAFFLPQEAIETGFVLAHAHDAVSRASCNLPVPAGDFTELQTCGWRGFRFLGHGDDDFEKAADMPGDLLRTLVFGPDYGLYLAHPASGLIVALQSGLMQLVTRMPDGFEVVDEVRTRRRAALTFCAHPSETLLVYGDNYGSFHAHHFSENGFGSARKIASRDNKAGAVEFIDPQTLLLGGTGYLAAFAYRESRFQLMHELSMPVRDFTWNQPSNRLFVNQGLHGIAVLDYTSNGFSQCACLKPPYPVNQIAVSKCGNWIAASSQSAASVSIFRMPEVA